MTMMHRVMNMRGRTKPPRARQAKTPKRRKSSGADAGKAGRTRLRHCRHHENRAPQGHPDHGDTSSAAQAIHHDERVRMTSKPINADEFIVLLRQLIKE